MSAEAGGAAPRRRPRPSLVTAGLLLASAAVVLVACSSRSANLGGGGAHGFDEEGEEEASESRYRVGYGVDTPMCAFDVRLAPGCECAAALRRTGAAASAARSVEGRGDQGGGGVVFPKVSEGMNAFFCPPVISSLVVANGSSSAGSSDDGERPGEGIADPRERLVDLTLRLECASGCVPSGPHEEGVDLARVPVETVTPWADVPYTAPHRHLGSLTVTRSPPPPPPHFFGAVLTRGGEPAPADGPAAARAREAKEAEVREDRAALLPDTAPHGDDGTVLMMRSILSNVLKAAVSIACVAACGKLHAALVAASATSRTARLD